MDRVVSQRVVDVDFEHAVRVGVVHRNLEAEIEIIRTSDQDVVAEHLDFCSAIVYRHLEVGGTGSHHAWKQIQKYIMNFKKIRGVY